ncbi:MAG: hypothetical protein KF817_03315 [Phycisphaeraceae bacterium]|nr:hypothetical protein [Phycisphaeraceae bacterium]
MRTGRINHSSRSAMIVALLCTMTAMFDRPAAAGPAYPIEHGVGFHSFDAWNTWMAVHLGAERETIGFYEVPVGTWVTDHYAHLGVTFNSSLGSQVWGVSESAYPNDGYGLRSSAEMRVEFDAPIRAIGVHWWQGSRFRFFLEGVLIYQSPSFAGAAERFVGLVMDFEFDAVEVRTNQDSHGDPPLHIDDFHFQRIVPVPGPSVLLVLVMSALTARASRRRRPAAK